MICFKMGGTTICRECSVYCTWVEKSWVENVEMWKGMESNWIELWEEFELRWISQFYRIFSTIKSDCHNGILFDIVPGLRTITVHYLSFTAFILGSRLRIHPYAQIFLILIPMGKFSWDSLGIQWLARRRISRKLFPAGLITRQTITPLS